jgi:hypothetical protein
MAVHGVPRATGDLDVLLRPEAANAERVISALTEFGAPVAAHGISAADFQVPGNVYQIGLPPRRLDLMTSIDGVTFEEAWSSRVTLEIDGISTSFIGREALIRNKKSTGRAKDAVDVRLLEG